jgi:hypothetical protein
LIMLQPFPLQDLKVGRVKQGMATIPREWTLWEYITCI